MSQPPPDGKKNVETAHSLSLVDRLEKRYQNFKSTNETFKDELLVPVDQKSKQTSKLRNSPSNNE